MMDIAVVCKSVTVDAGVRGKVVCVDLTDVEEGEVLDEIGKKAAMDHFGLVEEED